MPTLRIRTLAVLLSGASLGGVLLTGCGSGGGDSGRAASTKGPPADAVVYSPGRPRRHGEQQPAPALAACHRAVARYTTLQSAAKHEISELCYRINDVVEDNEATVESVCQELANAVTAAGDSEGKKRVYSTCFGEYATTVHLP